MKVLTNLLSILIVQVTCISSTNELTITNGHCLKNTSVKYQVPVAKTRVSPHNVHELLTYTEQYVDYEERIRWDAVQICCPGYRTIIFGLCAPICMDACPPHSYCAEPNKCVCVHGYEPSHHSNREQQLICRPICTGGCPEHSHCVGHNECDCRAGFRDVSIWFSPLRCERVHCGADQRYDIPRRMCVKIEMSVEELMQKVAEKLAKGFDVTETDIEMESNEN